MSSYSEKSLESFRNLAEINKRSHSLPNSEYKADPSTILQIISLIESKTHNYALREELASKYNIPVSQEWAEDIKNEFNASSCQSNDPLYLGSVYLSLGRYVEALSYFGKCHERLLLTSNLQILLENWTYITTTVGKAFTDWLQTSSSYDKVTNVKTHAVSQVQKPNQDLLSNLALAYFALCEYANCLCVLLRSDSPLVEDHAWLTFENIRSMLFICATVSLTRETLFHFQKSDLISYYFKVNELLIPVLNCDLEKFWSNVRELVLPAYANRSSVYSASRNHLCPQWLELHNRVPSDTALTELGREYTLCDSQNEESFEIETSRSDLVKWNCPYDIDLSNSWVTLRSEEREYSLSTSKLRSTADKFALEYKRDALVLLWNHCGNNTEIGIK